MTSNAPASRASKPNAAPASTSAATRNSRNNVANPSARTLSSRLRKMSASLFACSANPPASPSSPFSPSLSASAPTPPSLASSMPFSCGHCPSKIRNNLSFSFGAPAQVRNLKAIVIMGTAPRPAAIARFRSLSSTPCVPRTMLSPAWPLSPVLWTSTSAPTALPALPAALLSPATFSPRSGSTHSSAARLRPPITLLPRRPRSS